MSGAGARLNVFPTRQNLQVMKVKLVGAKKGHSLLKKKADALTMRLRALLKNILTAKDDMGAAFKDGNFALAEVKYAAGDIKPTIIESIGLAQKKVEIRVDNIAGVKVPVFKAIDVAAAKVDHTGLSKGGQQITKVRQGLLPRSPSLCPPAAPSSPLLSLHRSPTASLLVAGAHGLQQGRRRAGAARHAADVVCDP